MSFGRRHPQAVEAIMCVLLVLPPGCQYAMPCTSMGSSMHARTPLDGALPVSGSSRPGHSVYLYGHRYCTCTCVEKSRFPQAHLGTFPRLLSERGCVFLASPSNGLLGDPISPDPPRESFELIDPRTSTLHFSSFPFLSLPSFPFPILREPAQRCLFAACLRSTLCCSAAQPSRLHRLSSLKALRYSRFRSQSIAGDSC